MRDDDVLVKLDFRNAFNSVHREDIFKEVHKNLPELLPFVCSAYGRPTILRFGSSVVFSSEGTQQGDPLGALLFCLAVHPLIESLVSELSFGYLDDLTIGGKVCDVECDVERVIEVGSAMGLHLNVAKSEIVAPNETIVTGDALLAFSRVEVSNLTLLGAPLFPGRAMDDAWEDRCNEMSRAACKLKDIPAQNSLILMRSTLGAPRIQHLLRCSLEVGHHGIDRFDSLQREALSTVTNSALSDNNWLQSKLPIKDGGLGIRSASDLAVPSLLSSAHRTAVLQDAILSKRPVSTDDKVRDIALKWSDSFGLAPTGINASKQAEWLRPLIVRDKAKVLSELVTERDLASFKAAEAPHSGDWLTTLPISSCGLRLDDDAVRVAVALRLGQDVCLPHVCRCGVLVDSFGSHAFICKHSSGKIARHAAVNDIIARAFASIGVPITKEPDGLIKGVGKRPDGLTLIPWQNGKPLAWDSTISTPLASSYVSASARSAGSSAELAADKKNLKYAYLAPGISFQAIALDSLGGVSASTASFINDLGHRISATSLDPAESSHLWQRIMVCLMRYNSVLLHQSFNCEAVDPDE